MLPLPDYEEHKPRMVLSIASTRQIDIKARVNEARAHPCIYLIAVCASVVSVMSVFTPAGCVVSEATSITLFWRFLGSKRLEKGSGELVGLKYGNI